MGPGMKAGHPLPASASAHEIATAAKAASR